MGRWKRFLSCFRQPAVAESNDQNNTVTWQHSTDTNYFVAAVASATEPAIVSCTTFAKSIKPPFMPVVETELRLSVAAVVTTSPKLGYPIIKDWKETPATPTSKGSSSSTNSSPVSDKASSISLTCTETTTDADCAAVDSLSDIPLFARVILLLSYIHSAQGSAGLAAFLTYGLLSLITMLVVTVASKVHSLACSCQPLWDRACAFAATLATGLDLMAIWSGAAAVVLPNVNAMAWSYMAANRNQPTIHVGFGVICTFFLGDCAWSAVTGIQHLLQLGRSVITCAATEGFHVSFAAIQAVSWAYAAMVLLFSALAILLIKVMQVVCKARADKPTGSQGAAQEQQGHAASNEEIRALMRTNPLAVRESQEGYAVASDITIETPLHQAGASSCVELTGSVLQKHQAPQQGPTVPNATRASDPTSAQKHAASAVPAVPAAPTVAPFVPGPTRMPLNKPASPCIKTEVSHAALKQLLARTQQSVKQYSSSSDCIALHAQKFVSDDRELQAQQLYKVRAGSSKQGGWSFTRAAYSPAVRLVAPCSAGPDTHQAVAFLGKGKSGYVSYGELKTREHGIIPCAVKCLPYKTAWDRQQADQELQALLDTDHLGGISHCRAVFQTETQEGQACLQLLTEAESARRYCEGYDLTNLFHYLDWQADLKGLADTEAVNRAAHRDVMKRLAQVVAQLHSEGRAHFDLKPANIRVQMEGFCVVDLKLIDLGSCNVIQGDAKFLPSITPQYASPEFVRAVARGRPDVVLSGCAQDVWSMGCILLELCMGDNPFNGLGATPQECLDLTWQLHEDWAELYREQEPAPWVSELEEDLQLTISEAREYHALMEMMMPMLHPAQHARPAAVDLLSFSLLQ